MSAEQICGLADAARLLLDSPWVLLLLTLVQRLAAGQRRRTPSRCSVVCLLTGWWRRCIQTAVQLYSFQTPCQPCHSSRLPPNYHTVPSCLPPSLPLPPHPPTFHRFKKRPSETPGEAAEQAVADAVGGVLAGEGPPHGHGNSPDALQAAAEVGGGWVGRVRYRTGTGRPLVGGLPVYTLLAA